MMKCLTQFKKLIIISTIFFLLQSVTVAQENILYRGDLIRIKSQRYFPGGIIGQLRALQHDSLTFVYSHDKLLFTIPLQEIQKLEVARGTKSKTGKGALIGAVSAGLGLGLLFAIDVSDEQDEWFTPTPGQAFLGGLIFGGLIGSLTGAIIGKGISSPRWVEVSVNHLNIVEKTVVESSETSKLPQGEQPVLEPHKSQRRWRFFISLGNNSRGPADDIENAMRHDGFDDTEPAGWFGGPTEHPLSHTGFGGIGVPWSAELNYHFNRRYGIAMLLAETPMGETIGYRKDPAVYLTIKYRVRILGSMFIYNPAGILQLYAGPALFLTEMEQEDTGIIIHNEEKSQPGFILQATFLYPQHTTLFVMLNAQYRWTSPKTFGPFTTTAGNNNIPQRLNAFKVDFTHTYLGFGLGLHF